MSEFPVENNQALEKLNNNLLERMNDRGIIASYLITSFYKITNPAKSTHFKLVKESNSNTVNDLLIHNSIPSTLHDNLLTFCDTGRIFELKRHILKMITNKNYNVEVASLPDKNYFMILQKNVL